MASTLAEWLDWLPRWAKALAALIAAMGFGMAAANLTATWSGLPGSVSAQEALLDSAWRAAQSNRANVRILRDQLDATLEVQDELLERVRVIDRRTCRYYATSEVARLECDTR